MGEVRKALHNKVFRCPNCQAEIKGIINLTQHIWEQHQSDAYVLHDMLSQLSIPIDVHLFHEYLHKHFEALDES